jgi:hypothetical protein
MPLRLPLGRLASIRRRPGRTAPSVKEQSRCAPWARCSFRRGAVTLVPVRDGRRRPAFVVVRASRRRLHAPCLARKARIRRPSLSSSRPPWSARSSWRPSVSRAAGRASSNDAGPLTLALLLRQERGHQARADGGFRSGRRARVVELVAVGLPLRLRERRRPLAEIDRASKCRQARSRSATDPPIGVASQKCCK